MNTATLCDVSSRSLPRRAREAIDHIKAVVTQEPTTLLMAYSGGTGSTVAICLALSALGEVAQAGQLDDEAHHSVVTAGKNHEQHVARHLQAMRAFGVKNDVPLVADHQSLPFGASRHRAGWPVKSLTESRIVLAPANDNLRQVVLLGSRFESGSPHRVNPQQFSDGGERDDHDHHLVHPIAAWSTSDVWDYLVFGRPFGTGSPFPTYAASMADVVNARLGVQHPTN